jgi:hypothetical protein
MRLLIKRLVFGAVIAILGVGAVGTAIVVASSDDGDPESGSLAEVRHASPPRSAPPEVVAKGRTASGQAYELLVSQADELVCVAVHYGTPPNPAAAGALALHSSEFCADPTQQPVASSMDQLFINPNTGKISPIPQRFVYGLAAEATTDVTVRGPEGKSDRLELTNAPGAVKVFAGSVTGHAPGNGSVVATDGARRGIGQEPLKFAAPQHTSEAEAQKLLDSHE